MSEWTKHNATTPRQGVAEMDLTALKEPDEGDETDEGDDCLAPEYESDSLPWIYEKYSEDLPTTTTKSLLFRAGLVEG